MLTMRRTDLAFFPAFADWEDWTVLDDGRIVGRIYGDRSRGTTPELRWVLVDHLVRAAATWSPHR